MRAGISTGGGPGQARLRRATTVLLALALAAGVAGCASRGSPAPVTHLGAADVSQPAFVVNPPAFAGPSYTVLAGDTLYSIARRNGMSVEELARLNQIDDPTQLHVGQVLRLGAAPAPAPVVPPVTPPVAGTTPPAGDSAPISSSAPRASDAELIRWAWPANGRILQAFNVNTKGIDLEGKVGDPVKAAADGTVMYSGNGVRGLGNLILLGHSDGFISAYAHNQTLLVKTGDKIKQGAQIASVGQSDTTSPRLHFEIRRRGTPVNPMSYLPAR